MFQPGDRVRWASLGDDGFPIVRYGFVRGSNGDHDRVAVMLDGDLKGDTVVDLDQLEPVTITNIELHLQGIDLLADASLRQGIVNLWTAEADQAGLEVQSLEYLGPRVWGTSAHACALIDDGTVQCWGFNAAGQVGGTPGTDVATPTAIDGLTGVTAILRAIRRADDAICVKADLPHPGET